MTVFLWICYLLIPATMIFFGQLWQTKPPKEINSAYGYRTARSMRSQEAWDYTHRTFGRWWRNLGIALAALSSVVMPFFWRAPGVVGTGLIVLQLAVLIVPVPFMEKDLKKKFGK